MVQLYIVVHLLQKRLLHDERQDKGKTFQLLCTFMKLPCEHVLDNVTSLALVFSLEVLPPSYLEVCHVDLKNFVLHR